MSLVCTVTSLFGVLLGLLSIAVEVRCIDIVDVKGFASNGCHPLGISRYHAKHAEVGKQVVFSTTPDFADSVKRVMVA